MNTGLDQYMDIFKDAVEDSAAKLTKSFEKILITKSFEKILIEVIILFMVIPRKINFTQMGRYGSHVEQTYRNAFGLKKSKSIDWLKLNVSLAKRFFGKQGRWAIAIDPSYISKAGKKTPHIGRFWSGCAQSVKHGLEIMGIGLIDIDAKDCMMLKAHQSLSNKELSLRNKTMVDFYISVIKRYRKELLKLSTLIVADAYFSTSTFVNGIKKEGFSLIRPIPRHSGVKLDLSSGRCRMARRNYSSLQTPHFRVKRYFFIIEPGSRSNFAFVTPKAILVLWTARLAISGNSILLSMLRSHH